jgi:gas vesicle protein
VERQNGHKSNGTFGAFLLGSMLGGLTASLLSLLWAPQSGDETQRQLREKADDLKMQAEDTITQGRDKAESRVMDARQAVASWLSQSAQELNRRAEQIRPTPPMRE